MSQPPARRLTPAVWLATGLGVGLVSPAPGTVGALWGLPWAWLLLYSDSPWWWLTVPLGGLLGVPLCTRAARDLGGQKDPGAIVWDEIATVPLVFALVPGDAGLATLLVGFVLHRVFDISKPPPCRRLERWPEGWGVMADDVAAAGYAAAVLKLLTLVWA